MKKPRIKLSTLSLAFVCCGHGVTGSGWSFREAWNSWREEMILKGKWQHIPTATSGESK